MARALRIEDLLLQSPPSPSVTKPRQGAPAEKKDTQSSQPTSRPNLVVKTATSLVRAKSPVLDRARFSWDVDQTQISTVGPRKRKSPVDSEGFPPKRPGRLPRFSVNIFHPEPVNIFPIPNEGCVPRMVKYCEHVSPKWPGLSDRFCRFASVGRTAWSSACIRGTPKTLSVVGFSLRSSACCPFRGHGGS